MEIKPGTFVEATYDLYVGEENEKELMEKATPEQPLRFVFGIGQMLEAFEKQLARLQSGDTFDFVLPSTEAYGEYNEEHVLELPKDLFLVNDEFDDEMIFPGNTVPMLDASGNKLNGSVLEVKDDVVVMDFNHPLAGEDLHFIGKIQLVREATPEELTPAGGCGGCGSDCNSHCDDNCHCGCDH